MAGADPILAHVERELVSIYHRMQGVGGTRGEHVRALAANLDLMAACLVRDGQDGPARAVIQEGLERFGRDALARELSDRHLECVVAQAGRFAIGRTVREDLEATGRALDAAARENISARTQSAVPQLLSLARRMDRSGRGPNAAAWLVGWQPTGDLDAPEEDGEFNCKGLKALIYYFGVASAVFGMTGQAILAGIFALYSILAQAVYDEKCAAQEETA